jgi:hypothetical protein
MPISDHIILGFEALLFPGLTTRNAIKLICVLSDAQDTTKVIIQYYIAFISYSSTTQHMAKS